MATDDIPFRRGTAVLPQQYSCEMAATKLTADGLLSIEESDPVNEDTRMDTDITYEEEDALLYEDRDEDVGYSDDSIPNAQREDVRGIQRMSQKARRGQVSRKPKSLQALRKQATTEAGSAKEKNHQSPPKLTAAPIERDHGMKKS